MARKQKKERNESWLYQLRRLIWLLLIPIGIALPRIASEYPDITERYYSSGIYPGIRTVIGWISSLVPFSLAEVIVVVVVLTVLIVLVLYVVRLFFRKIRPVRFVSMLLSLAIAGGILLNVFYWVWGLNYSRPTLYSLMELPVKERPVSELEALCHSLSDEARALREQVSEDASGVFSTEGGYAPYFEKLPEAYASLSKEAPLFSGKVYTAKPVSFSTALSHAGISGIYFPFTAEANVNADQPKLLLIASAAHEMAHYLGIAREDEANFVAYLACMASEDPAVRYSGVMLALINCANKLYDADEAKYTALRSTYSVSMNRDLSAHSAYWKSYEGPVEEAVSDMNDNYLKFNQQADGVKSYGLMVDLMLAYYYSS